MQLEVSTPKFSRHLGGNHLKMNRQNLLHRGEITNGEKITILKGKDKFSTNPRINGDFREAKAHPKAETAYREEERIIAAGTLRRRYDPQTQGKEYLLYHART